MLSEPQAIATAPNYEPVLAHDPRQGWCVARRLDHFWLVCTGGGEWPSVDLIAPDKIGFLKITPTRWARFPETPKD